MFIVGHLVILVIRKPLFFCAKSIFEIYFFDNFSPIYHSETSIIWMLDILNWSYNFPILFNPNFYWLFVLISTYPQCYLHLHWTFHFYCHVFNFQDLFYFLKCFTVYVSWPVFGDLSWNANNISEMLLYYTAH